VAVTTADPQPQPEIPTTPTIEKKPGERSKELGIGIFRFRFRLENFRIGRNFSLRRFSIAEAALLLMMGYLASRGLGVVRQSMFNALFGTGPEANAYYAAVRLPETLFNLIAGGALVHAFIPVFVSYEKEHSQRETWRLTSLVFNIMLVTLTALTLVAEIFTPAFVDNLLVPGFSPSGKALTTTLTRIMLIQPFILGLGTIASGILSSKRQFLLPALSLAVYNIGLIGGLLFSLAIPGVGIYGPTYGVLAAAACLVLVQLPALLKQGMRYDFYWNLKHPGLHDVLRLLIPGALTVTVASIGLIIDSYFASFFPDKASFSALHNAQLLFALPVALFAQAVSQAALPQMSSEAASGRYARLRQTALKVIGAALLLSVASAVLLYFLGKPTIRILFQHGAFTRHSSSLTNLALLGYAVGLPGEVTAQLLGRSFYALKRAYIPLLTNIVGLGIRYGFILLLLQMITGNNHILSIPLAASAESTCEALILALLLFIALHSKVKTDKGMQRLLRRNSKRRKEIEIPTSG